MAEEIVRGSITWNLPESIPFTPGDTIPITVIIANPTDEERLYFLGWALIRNGEMISFGGVEVEDIEDWVIVGNSSHEISFEILPEFSDCYLNMLLISGLTAEEEELEVVEEIIDSLSTYLYSAVAVTPLAVTAQWVQYIIPVLTSILLVVSTAKTVVPIIKEQFKK